MPFPGQVHHSRRDRILLDIPKGIHGVPIVHQDGEEPPFPVVACGPAPDIEPCREISVAMLDPRAEAGLVGRLADGMHVIWHQRDRADFHAGLELPPAHDGHVHRAALVVTENRLSVIAAVGDVVPLAGNDASASSSHVHMVGM